MITEAEFLANTKADAIAIENANIVSLGQRVTGKGTSSIYYVVATREGLSCSMRWKGNSLSIRIGGNKLPEVVERLKETALFTNHGHYWSAHMGQDGSVGAGVAAEMLYASMLVAVSPTWDKVAPYQWREWTSVKAAN